MEEQSPPVGGWRRGLGLFFLAAAISVTSPLPLVGVPFVMLAVTIGTRRLSTTLMAAMLVVWIFASEAQSDLWYLERGWAIVLGGWFVALTLYRPNDSVIGRAFGSVVGTFAVTVAAFAARPGTFGRIDWQVRSAVMDGAAAAVEAMRALGSGDGPSMETVDAVMRTADQQGELFPALLGLSSLAALGAGWWLYVRLAWSSDRGVGPLREFRFNDHLVWLFIAGLALLALGLGEAWSRAGTNAVVFMGALYAFRGAAVIAFLSGGFSLAGGLFLALALMFVGPLVIGGALLIGIGDTWLDVRTQVEKATGSES